MTTKNTSRTLKIKSAFPPGPYFTNHNETPLKVRKGISGNHNETALKIKKGIQGNHNETIIKISK